MIKLIVLCRRNQNLSRKAFIEHWRGVHARLAQADPDFWSRVRGYIQNYCLEPVGPPAGNTWDGVVELWFESRGEMDAAFSGEQTQRVLVADLGNFVDTNSMISLVTEENVIQAPTAAVSARALSLEA
jgi:uncharacterized protein (TIGR02118 family)